MKNLLIFAIFAILTFGCADQQAPEQSTKIVTETGTTETTETTEEEDTDTEDAETDTEASATTDDEADTSTTISSATLKLYAPGKFSDGVNWVLTNYEKRAGTHAYMIGSEIHTLDDFGGIVSVTYAPEVGDVVRKTASGYVLCDIITPTEAFALGAQAATYSQIHIYNGANWFEPNHWSTQKWQCEKIIESQSGEIFVIDSIGGIHAFGASTGVQAVNDRGLLITNLDLVNKRANFITASGSTLESWATNFLLAAKDWQEINGVFYSANGYKYSHGAGLQESVTAMTAFQSSPYPVILPNGEAPTMLPIGVNSANGVIYWLEANTGYLIEYRVATDQIIANRRMYFENGLRATGQALKKTLGLLFQDGCVYYTYGNVVNRLELSSGGISTVLSKNLNVEGY